MLSVFCASGEKHKKINLGLPLDEFERGLGLARPSRLASPDMQL